MVTRKNDKWEAKCTQCGWTGQADTKKAARELLREHLNIHRTPKPVTESKESDEVSSPTNKWPDLKKPGEDPLSSQLQCEQRICAHAVLMKRIIK
jgi:hypothetical protein